MKKIFLTALCSFLTAGLYAAEPAFPGASFAKQLAARGETPAPVPAPTRPAKARGGQYVQVSAYVTLNGSGWMPGSDGGFTTVNLTGWATFRDATGQITSNSTYINTSVSAWVKPNQYVFQTVNPSVFVTLYRDGKPVGSVNVTGSVSVSGWPTSGYFSLSGSGTLSGSLYAEDAN